MMCGDADSEKDASDILAEVREKTGKEPALAEDIIFSRSVEDIIAKKYGEETAKRAVDDVRRYTVKETERATYQAMEALIHNLNTMHSRAGAQIPFSSLNYGTDTIAEGRLVMKSILHGDRSRARKRRDADLPDTDLQGQGGRELQPRRPELRSVQARLPAYPRSACSRTSRSSTRRSIWQYYNAGHPETEVAYMGCRTRVIGERLRPDQGNRLRQRKPRALHRSTCRDSAIKAKGDVDWFFEELDNKIDLVDGAAHGALQNPVAKRTSRNYPFLMGQGIWIDSDKARTGRHGRAKCSSTARLTVGFIGLAECLKALIGIASRRVRGGAEPGSRDNRVTSASRRRRSLPQNGLNFTANRHSRRGSLRQIRPHRQKDNTAS